MLSGERLRALGSKEIMDQKDLGWPGYRGEGGDDQSGAGEASRVQDCPGQPGMRRPAPSHSSLSSGNSWS